MALSIMAEMTLYDANGNCRCPRCGKYTKRENIPDQPTSRTVRISGMVAHIHTVPMCNRCLSDAPGAGSK